MRTMRGQRTIQFKKCHSDDGYGSVDTFKHLFLCADMIRKIFGIKKDTKEFQIKISDKPFRGAVQGRTKRYKLVAEPDYYMDEWYTNLELNVKTLPKCCLEYIEEEGVWTHREGSLLGEGTEFWESLDVKVDEAVMDWLNKAFDERFFYFDLQMRTRKR